MNEICTICGRYYYSRDYPPRLCPICEEEAIQRGESAFHLLTPKGMPSSVEKRP